MEVRYLALFLLLSVIGSFGQFWMVSLYKNAQLMLEFYYYKLITFLMINVAIYDDDATLYSKCDQASDLWEQLELASELESDL